MEKTNTTGKGTLKVSEDVIITVARLAALDVKGVASLKGECGSIIKKSNAIQVSLVGDVIAIRIAIIVNSGEKAVAVAARVQEAVKENVQSMTGVAVARVNVIIEGIEF